MSDPTTGAPFFLTLPVVGSTVDPKWAAETNANWETLNATAYGSGSQVPSAGLNINGDVSWNGFNLTGLRALRMQIQSGTLTGANDKVELYSVNGDLYFNNSAGTAVRLTTGAQLATSGSNGSFGVKSVTSDLTVPSSATYNVLTVNTTAVRHVTLPASAAAPGFTLFVQDVTGNAASNPIQFIPVGSNTINGVNATASVAQPFGSWILQSNGAGNWSLMSSQQDVVNGEVLFASGSLLAVSGTLSIAPTAEVVLNDPTQLAFPNDVGRVVLLPCQQTFLAAGWANDVLFGLVGPGSSQIQGVLVLPGCLHNGATLSVVTVRFQVGQSHSSVPATLPNFQMFRVSWPNGGFQVVETLGSAGSPTPSTGASWYSSGNTQEFGLVLTQNNVIDRTTYTYYLGIVDEHGTNSLSGNLYHQLKLTYSQITSMQFE